MRRLIASTFFASFCVPASAMLIGNPAQPGLLTKGIAINYDVCNFRIGYLDDWVYKQKFQDEFVQAGSVQNRTSIEMSTYAGLITFNLKNRLDLYGIIGSSRLQIDDEIFTKRALSWGVGGKWLIFKHDDFFIGGDAKYFVTYQKPRYFVVDGAPYNNVLSNYLLKCYDVQVALGVAYRATPFCPYVNATYIVSKIHPQPAITLVRLPEGGEITDLETKSLVSKYQFGMAVGLTLLDCEEAALSCEWRGFNQNAVDVNLEVRF